MRRLCEWIGGAEGTASGTERAMWHWVCRLAKNQCYETDPVPFVNGVDSFYIL
jgi:hypothetical protein